jgi:hypothetical protein
MDCEVILDIWLHYDGLQDGIYAAVRILLKHLLYISAYGLLSPTMTRITVFATQAWMQIIFTLTYK